jgi:hypothetical protein
MKPKKRTHTSITGKTLFGTDAEFHLAFALPYARWICADRRELLVNAFGEPIWQRQPKEWATPADPYERPRNVQWVERLYDDADRHYEKRLAAKQCLADFKLGLWIAIAPERRQWVGDGLVQTRRQRFG